MNKIEALGDTLQAKFDQLNSLREQAIANARTLTRQAANAIRAVHRQEWTSAQEQLEGVKATANQLKAQLNAYPEIYFAGYTQDALKEYVEAFLVYDLVHGDDVQTPDELDIPYSTYINGLAEAASELRRHILDIIRQTRYDDAERMLEAMERVYTLLMSMNYPDAVTGGVRHRVDALRGVLERTRGDLTISRQQKNLQTALEALSAKLDTQRE